MKGYIWGNGENMNFHRLSIFLLLFPISAFAGNLSVHNYVEQGNCDLLERVLRLPEGGRDGRESVNSARSGDGNTPLHLVPEKDTKKKVELLLRYGADASLRNSHGFTPLTEAISHQRFKLFNALANERERGGINATDDRKRTPLNWVMRRHPRSVQKELPLFYDQEETAATLLQLLERDADPRIPDGLNQTPIHWAARLGCSKCVFALGQHMNSATVQDDDGLTPLHRAIYNYAACIGVKQAGDQFLKEAHAFCTRFPNFTKEEAAKVCLLLLAKTNPDQIDERGVSSTNLLFGLLGVNHAADIISKVTESVPNGPVLDISKGVLELDVRRCASQLSLSMDKFERLNRFYEYDISKSRTLRLALLGCIEPRYLACSGDPNVVDTNGLSSLMWLCHLDPIMSIDMRSQLDLYLKRGADPLKNDPSGQSPFIYFYGTGIVNEEKRGVFEKALQHVKSIKPINEPIMHTLTVGQIEDSYRQLDSELITMLKDKKNLNIEYVEHAIETAQTPEDKKKVMKHMAGIAMFMYNNEVFEYILNKKVIDVASPENGYTPLMLACSSLAGSRIIDDGKEKLFSGELNKLIQDAKVDKINGENFDSFLQQNPSLRLSKMLKEGKDTAQRYKELAEKYPTMFTFGFIMHSKFKSDAKEDMLDILLKQKGLIFGRDPQGYSVFDYFAIANDIRGLEKLFAYKENQEISEDNQEYLNTALKYADKYNCLDAQEWLILHGAQVQSLPEEGRDKLCASLYRHAFTERNTGLLKKLFNDGLSPNLIVFTGKKQWTLLHKAARDDDEDMVNFLIQQNGIHLDVKDHQGKTPVDLASNGTLKETIKSKLKEAQKEAWLARIKAPAFVPKFVSTAWNVDAVPFIPSAMN